MLARNARTLDLDPVERSTYGNEQRRTHWRPWPR